MRVEMVEVAPGLSVPDDWIITTVRGVAPGTSERHKALFPEGECFIVGAEREIAPNAVEFRLVHAPQPK